VEHAIDRSALRQRLQQMRVPGIPHEYARRSELHQGNEATQTDYDYRGRRGTARTESRSHARSGGVGNDKPSAIATRSRACSMIERASPEAR
jgi:hypothetical protein